MNKPFTKQTFSDVAKGYKGSHRFSIDNYVDDRRDIRAYYQADIIAL